MQAAHVLLSRVRAPLLAAAMVMAAGAASAQWQWINAEGRKVFSDTPPPASVPEKNVLKRPGARAAPPAAEAAESADGQPAAAPAAAPASDAGKDKELQAKMKQAEEAEAAKRKAELERVAKARAENCERAKRAKATLDSGVRIATTNAKGEREIMDDNARAAEGRRLDGIIAADCGPMTPAPQ